MRTLLPGLGAAALGIAVLAFCGAFALFVKGSAEDARGAEDAKRVEAQAAELAALPDDAPLETFLTHLFIDKSEEHQRKAVERIRALPELTERMAAPLEHPEPLQREYVLNFVKMVGTPDPAWEPLMRRAIVRLAADYRAEEKDLSLNRITHVKGLSWSARGGGRLRPRGTGRPPLRPGRVRLGQCGISPSAFGQVPVGSHEAG